MKFLRYSYQGETFSAGLLISSMILGCVGKWAIHPSQIDIALDVYSPKKEDVERARKLEKAYAEAEATRCLLYREAARVSPESRNRLGTDAAKLFAAPAAKRIADNAMQVLGGYGYTQEYKIERFLRDAKLNEIGGGTLESHQKNITRDLTRDRLQRG